jgi:hypothetical protein
MLELVTNYGVIEIVGDAQQMPTRCHLLDMDSLKLAHYGDSVVKFVERDGLRMVPASNYAGWEVRLAAYANVECDRPWSNGSCTLV